LMCALTALPRALPKWSGLIITGISTVPLAVPECA
jgi:hypothetical protein